MSWFTPAPSGVQVSLPGHICAVLAAVAAQLPTPGSTATVRLPRELEGDPLARWEIEEKQARLDKHLQSVRDAADEAVLSRFDVSLEDLLSVELSREEASLWLQWLNRHYVVLRGLELEEVTVGQEQSLLMMMGSEIFGEQGGDSEGEAEMSFPTMLFAFCSDRIIAALAS